MNVVSKEVKSAVYVELFRARSHTFTALKDLQNRGDRIDALDSIAAAKRALTKAEEGIRATLPPGMSVGAAACHCGKGGVPCDCPIHGG